MANRKSFFFATEGLDRRGPPRHSEVWQAGQDLAALKKYAPTISFSPQTFAEEGQQLREKAALDD